MKALSKNLSLLSGIIILTFAPFPALLSGQPTPINPVSYRIFSPFIFNPAIAGSKDFFSIDLLTSKYGDANSQVLSGNLRLLKHSNDYFSSPGTPEFTKIGIGALVFNELDGLSRNNGFSGTASFHLPLDKENLSFLSFGASGKVVYNQYSGNPDLSDSSKNTVIPNIDAGVYYYNKSLFAGLSVTNIPGNPEEPDTLGIYKIPLSRQLFFQLGYRIVLSKSHNILLEPSIIVNSDDTFSKKIADMIKPALKLYAGSFCTGTFFNDFNKMSFFMQYKYPRFYIAAYFELPNKEPFYKSPIRTEFALGLNISSLKSQSTRLNHW